VESLKEQLRQQMYRNTDFQQQIRDLRGEKAALIEEVARTKDADASAKEAPLGDGAGARFDLSAVDERVWKQGSRARLETRLGQFENTEYADPNRFPLATLRNQPAYWISIFRGDAVDNFFDDPQFANPVIGPASVRGDLGGRCPCLTADPFLQFSEEKKRWYLFFEVGFGGRPMDGAIADAAAAAAALARKHGPHPVSPRRPLPRDVEPAPCWGGKIGVASSPDLSAWRYEKLLDDAGTFAKQGHFSYPYVFKHAGAYYMLPDTVDAVIGDGLLTTTAARFPFGWKQARGGDGVPSGLTDRSMFTVGGRWYVFGADLPRPGEQGSRWYEGVVLRLFWSDTLLGKYQEHPSSVGPQGLVSDPNAARPGGRVVVTPTGRVFRFAQDLYPAYGDQGRRGCCCCCAAARLLQPLLLRVGAHCVSHARVPIKCSVVNARMTDAWIEKKRGNHDFSPHSRSTQPVQPTAGARL
jgi:hypothetical protein